jgi:hypothetical protein
MTRDAHQYIAENRQDIRDTQANFIEVTAEGTARELSFPRNLVLVSVEVEIYKRPLNTSLISGHPDGSTHGSGYGEAGDLRGDWTLAEDVENSTEWTKDGRTAVRDALNGDAWEIKMSVLGDGTGDAQTTDTDLGDRQATVFAFGTKDAANVTRGHGLYRFNQHNGAGTEFGLLDDDGRLLCRVTVGDVAPTTDEEVRAELVLTFSGDAAGDSVIVDDGEKAVADAMRLDDVAVGLLEMAWGTGTTAFSESDTALTSEEIRKNVVREKEVQSLRVFGKLYTNEPATQPVDLSEVAVFDNNGNMVWATTFDPQEKDDSAPMTTTVGYRFR